MAIDDADWSCLKHEFKTGAFWKKWLYCSWAHRMVWTTTNKGKRVKVSGRCYPHVWHDPCEYWHCSECHPCGEEIVGLIALSREQRDLPPEFKDVIEKNFWDLL